MATILVELFRHNLWANLRLLDLCGGLTDEQLALSAPGTYGKVSDTLLHLCGAEERYLMRFDAVSPDSALQRGQPFPGVADLRRHAQRSGEAFVRIAENDPSGQILRGTWQEQPYAIDAAVFLIQAIDHATEHRSHVVGILTQNGVDVPSLDGWTYGEAMGLS
jgi:uncharacterized damage-inducible protein DinB